MDKTKGEIKKKRVEELRTDFDKNKVKIYAKRRQKAPLRKEKPETMKEIENGTR